jgi:predicted peptidase
VVDFVQLPKSFHFFALAALMAVPVGVVAWRQLARWLDKAARDELSKALAARMQAGVFRDPVSDNVMPWRLYVPPGVESLRSLPLVIAFHGGGGKGSDNLKQLDGVIRDLLSDALQGIEPVMVLAPQAEERTHWVDYPGFDPPFRNFDQCQIPQSENLKSAIRLLRQIIDKHDADRSRVYVIGFSMGGEASWDAITYYPEMFAAALIMAGAGDPRAMERVRSLPIRFFHGDRDDITPTENSRELDAALRALGAMARYTEIPGVGHDIPGYACTRENFAWLLRQRRASPTL